MWRCLLVSVLAVSCASNDRIVREKTPLECRAPKDPTWMMFAGQSTAMEDDDAATETARERALGELAKYVCGEVEPVGMKREKLVGDNDALTVDLEVRAGGSATTLTGARVAALEAVKTGDGYAACAQIEVPKAQVEALIAADVAALAAVKAELDASEAMCGVQGGAHVREVQKTLERICGNVEAGGTTRAALEERAAKLLKDLDDKAAAQKTHAVLGMVCTFEGQPTPCATVLQTKARAVMQKAGLDVDEQMLPDEVAATIAKGGSASETSCAGATAVVTMTSKIASKKKIGKVTEYTATADAAWILVKDSGTTTGPTATVKGNDYSHPDGLMAAAGNAIEAAKLPN
jgi:hypothetical protein